MTEELQVDQEAELPFKNLTVYAELNGQPMRFVLPEGAEQDLMFMLAQLNMGMPLVMEPLKEGSKVEVYEEPPRMH